MAPSGTLMTMDTDVPEAPAQQPWLDPPATHPPLEPKKARAAKGEGQRSAGGKQRRAQLLDACINNCGRKFLLEVASREFEQELRKIITNTRAHHKSKTGITSDLKIRIFVLLHRYRQRQILPLSESITPWAMPIRRKTS
ncbi:hypothetical protein GWK47_005774 [Chionoecetes opilio]|uniref:VHS domain-containing protein n=1 Tax=Chionoecetes opilio TaxID=41210 RepID=A0A8J5CVX4_CHIOP|nr:hypothetical protein GWK47_005774 [Chionoecetes opilio]